MRRKYRRLLKIDTDVPANISPPAFTIEKTLCPPMVPTWLHCGNNFMGIK
jgi:hypothetical protein